MMDEIDALCAAIAEHPQISNAHKCEGGEP